MVKSRHLSTAAALAAVATSLVVLRAQAPATAPATPPATPPPVPGFVASVKPADPTSGQIMIRNAPGRIDMVGVPLAILVRQAYQVQDFQVVGAPPWMTSDRFDIQANIEGGQTQPGQMPVLLQALLKDRFAFAAHREQREMPIYALTLARSDGRLGPGLKPSSPDCVALIESRGRGAGPGGPGPGGGGPGGQSVLGAGPGGPGGAGGPGRGGRIDGPPDFNQPAPCGTGRIGPGMMSSSGQRITQVLTFLSQQTGRVVQDKTGLTGIYDIDLKWTPEPGQSALGLPPIVGGPPPQLADPNAPTLVTALQEQLGLKLDNQRGAVDVLVIDKVEKPKEN